MHNLGRPPRRIVFLHLDGSGHTLPEAGTEIRVNDGTEQSAASRPIGRVTSVARHYTDGPIALAVIKRNTDPAADLLVGTTNAAQTVIVPA